MRSLFLIVVLAPAFVGCADKIAQPPVSASATAAEPPRTAAVPAHAIADPARGEALYRTACQGCHDRETHWRNRHWVTDWPTLVQQVTRWQGIAGQTWSADEIEDVSSYLNRRFYEVPCPLPRCAAGTVG